MSIGLRIAEARRLRGWSQARLGEAVGAVQTTVSSWERGRTEPTREDVQKIAEAIGVSAADLELQEYAARAPSRTGVPLVGYVAADPSGQAVLFSYGQGPFDEVDAPEGSTSSTVAAEVRGQSLGPVFDRWLVYYDDVREPVTPDLHGELCVVALLDGRMLVKQLRPAGRAGFYHLISNASEEPMFDIEVAWAAKVKSMRPR